MNVIAEYRDDGPLAAAIGRALPLRFLNPVFLFLLGTAPLGGAIAWERDAGPWTGAALAWFVLLGGASSVRVATRGLDWLAPVVVRLTEYGATIALVALVETAALPAAYAALFAASIHQYETVYRIRHLKVPPPRWVSWVAGGWEIRLVLVWVLARTEYLSEGLYAIAAAIGTLFVIESAAVWIGRPDEA